MASETGFPASITFLLKVGGATVALLGGFLVAVIVGFLSAVVLIPIYASQIVPVITIGISGVIVIIAYLWFVAKLCQRTSVRYNLPIPLSGLAFPMINVWLVVAALRFNERRI